MNPRSAATAEKGFQDLRRRRSFQRKLLNWYSVNRRDLPWRVDRDPYRVWISEIMLQQTRVAAVIPYYNRFLRRFPTIHKLASAPESAVLAAWSGLGYYRRARMLHAASKKVAIQFHGEFPTSQKAWSDLPGIGRYTSAAIASIAFGEPVAVVDGNVTRVIQRLLAKDIRGDQLWKLAEQLLCRDSPGDFNQGLMELGATICLPKRPKCDMCPVRQECSSRDSPEKSQTRSKQVKREICYALDYRDGSVFLVKRPADCPVMPGMWELPETRRLGAEKERCIRLRHSITVTDFDVLVIRGPAPKGLSGKWVKTSRTGTLPLTGLTGKILRAAQII